MIGIWRRAADLMLYGDYYPLTPFHRSAGEVGGLAVRLPGDGPRVHPGHPPAGVARRRRSRSIRRGSARMRRTSSRIPRPARRRSIAGERPAARRLHLRASAAQRRHLVLSKDQRQVDCIATGSSLPPMSC